MDLPLAQLHRFDPTTGTIEGAPVIERRLSDLEGCFADVAAYAAALAEDDPVVYTVASVEPAQGEGQLHYGLGTLMPGRVGGEYFLTRGHVHAWRPAAELYIGVEGEGCMLLEEESTGTSKTVALLPQHAVYVPGFTAHRTINTGPTRLSYLGVYPAAAGHDYGAIAQRNFRQVVVEVDGRPTTMARAQFLASLRSG